MVHWVPKNELGKFVSAFFGVDIGHVVGSIMCAYLIETFGWKWAYYVPAIFGVVFVIWTWWTIFDKPAEHPRISQAEQNYIEENLIGKNTGPKVNHTHRQQID